MGSLGLVVGLCTFYFVLCSLNLAFLICNKVPSTKNKVQSTHFPAFFAALGGGPKSP